MDDVTCNTTCAGNDGTDEFQSTFCGGSGPLSSVYVTVGKFSLKKNLTLIFVEISILTLTTTVSNYLNR